MKDFFTAFLDRFKHPILYSVITALIIHNFDFIYLLIIAPFHYAEMKPEDVIVKFVKVLQTYRTERFWLPVVTGTLLGAFLPSIVDILYSTLIAFAMNIKEKWVYWSKRSSWSFKIDDARRISICLAESWEDPELWIGMNKFTLGTKCYLFRCSKDVNIGDVVVYNSKKNIVEQASWKNNKILGIVYEIFYQNLALVVTEGAIIDDVFIHMFINERKDGWELNLGSSGKLKPAPKDVNTPDRIATIQLSTQRSDGRELSLIRTNLDPEAIALPIGKRLFGEDEVKLTIL